MTISGSGERCRRIGYLIRLIKRSNRICHREARFQSIFVESITGEITGTLPAASADHYIFNGGLTHAFQGLARYYRKRAAAPA